LAAGSHSWIKAYHRPDGTKHSDDGLVVASEAEAFLDGLQLALNTCPNPDFIVKLDADLRFAPNYFTVLFDEFTRNDKLGIASGVIYEYKGSDLVRAKASVAHTRGASKVYRNSCYIDIGGIRPIFGWDVIDEIIARAGGWYVTSFDHVHLVHLRRMASRDGRFAGWARNGYMAYYIGMSPLRILLRALFHLVVSGDLIQSCGLAYGYFRNFLMRGQKLPDPELRKLVRKYQWVTAQASFSKR